MSGARQLRPEIELADAGFDITGAPGVVLNDPLAHRFFWLPAGVKQALLALQSSPLGRADDALGLFLAQAGLLQPSTGTDKQVYAQWRARQAGVMASLLHNYLFFRVPLLRPERFLDATLPWVAPLAGWPVRALLVLLTLVAVYLTSRQWDAFLAMVQASFSLAGAANVMLALVALKVFHELGHAYVARAFGCRVPSMGVSFMVMAPMLYTDASDAWRLSSRRQRFLIGAAGVMVECALASIALLLWAILPDGTVRGICFFVAVTALGMSLLVNLSPFMRFDGYHMLADALGMHSLGPRSFALANWWLRELLFLPGEAPPAFLPPPLRRALVAYAFATWAYRLVVFLGIAWLLFATLPKVVGLPLALVEVWFFVARPVLVTVRGWFQGQGLRLLTSRRAMLTGGVWLIFLLLGFLPLDRAVHMPAVLFPAQEARVYAPEPAQIIQLAVRPGMRVAEGDVLARLMVPEIGHLQRQAQLRLGIAETRIARVAADRRDRAERLVQERLRDTAKQQLQALRDRGRKLVLRAPVAGLVTGDSVALREGQWVKDDELLFLIAATDGARLVALLPERDSERVAEGAELTFVADDGVSPARQGRLDAIGLPGGEGQAMAYLSSRFGGAVPDATARNGNRPLVGHVPVLAAVEGPAPPAAQAGTAVTQATPQSLFGFLFQRLVTVVLRESGF